MWFETIPSHNNNSYKTTAYINQESVCRCVINRKNETWTISSWYTENNHQHNGYGKLTLKECLNRMANDYKLPESVKYIWNGVNEYVLDWLKENFDAVCDCPMVVQKYASDDDWSSHIYTLNRDKFLSYFEFEEELIK